MKNIGLINIKVDQRRGTEDACRPSFSAGGKTEIEDEDEDEDEYEKYLGNL